MLRISHKKWEITAATRVISVAIVGHWVFHLIQSGLPGLDLCVEIEALGYLPHPHDFHGHKGSHQTKNAPTTVPIGKLVTANYRTYPLTTKPVNRNPPSSFTLIDLLTFNLLWMVAKSCTSL